VGAKRGVVMLPVAVNVPVDCAQTVPIPKMASNAINADQRLARPNFCQVDPLSDFIMRPPVTLKPVSQKPDAAPNDEPFGR
jgi:hypothetical protein